MLKQVHENENISFSQFFSGYSLVQSRIALLLGIVMYMVFVVLDYWMIPDVQSVVLWIRMSVTFLMVGVLIYTFTGFFRPAIGQALYILSSLATGLGIVYMISLTNSEGGKIITVTRVMSDGTEIGQVWLWVELPGWADRIQQYAEQHG